MDRCRSTSPPCPDWKQAVGRELDALIVESVPGVTKAVRWNSPFYGVEGQGWFLNFHCLTKYIKVTFFDGASLEPEPPIKHKDERARFFHVFEGDEIDRTLVASWIKQASKLPGWTP